MKCFLKFPAQVSYMYIQTCSWWDAPKPGRPKMPHEAHPRIRRAGSTAAPRVPWGGLGGPGCGPVVPRALRLLKAKLSIGVAAVGGFWPAFVFGPPRSRLACARWRSAMLLLNCRLEWRSRGASLQVSRAPSFALVLRPRVAPVLTHNSWARARLINSFRFHEAISGYLLPRGAQSPW